MVDGLQEQSNYCIQRHSRHFILWMSFQKTHARVLIYDSNYDMFFFLKTMIVFLNQDKEEAFLNFISVSKSFL